MLFHLVHFLVIKIHSRVARTGWKYHKNLNVIKQSSVSLVWVCWLSHCVTTNCELIICNIYTAPAEPLWMHLLYLPLANKDHMRTVFGELLHTQYRLKCSNTRSLLEWMEGDGNLWTLLYKEFGWWLSMSTACWTAWKVTQLITDKF